MKKLSRDKKHRNHEDFLPTALRKLEKFFWILGGGRLTKKVSHGFGFVI